MLRELTSTKMILHWTLMLTVFILCEHAKVTVPEVTELQALDMWRLEVKWMMDQNEEQRNQTYEIQVGRSTNMDIVDSMNVSRGSLEAVHTLVWTSQLPLNCVDHSVRIRFISEASPPSSWSSWKTIYGRIFKMFPDDQVLREGSTVMFCCIYPKETHIISMFFSNTPYKVINISPQVKAIRVENIKATNSFGVNFYCDRNSDVSAYNFVTCEYVSHCPTQFKCPHLSKNSIDSKSVSCDVEDTDPASCRFDVIPHQITYNITLLVTNSLGQESETYTFSITDRGEYESFYVKIKVEGSDTSVMWNSFKSGTGLKTKEMLKHILCSSVVVVLQDLDKNGSDSMQSYAFRLQHLKPSKLYSVRGRCAVQGNDWGRWTTQRQFITDRGSVLTRFTLPQVSSDSESFISAYEVCVGYRNTERNVCRNVTQTQVELTREINMSNITVRAVIQSGLSEPAHITIPSAHTGDKRIMGNEKGFQLTWTRDSTATCGYTIEWCMLGIALPCNLQWRKVPANQTFLNLTAGDFKAGVQYAFEIYGCSAEGHRRHEKQIGYLKEQSKSAHTLYMPHYSGAPNSCQSTLFLIQSVDDPHSKSWTVGGLEEDRPYTFQLAACTSAGCGPETTATFRTRQNCELRY
uniref:Oncostatin M receptor n=1 Tax=Cyprinus carpio TaxID=7962 RepID=A0A8C2BA93_CYPCA